MKRTPMPPRRTPMKRTEIARGEGPKRKRRGPARRSKKLRSYESATRMERDSWKSKHPHCFACYFESNQLVPAVDCHEIERRSQAPYRWARPCNYFATCRRHHDRMGSLPNFGAEWPHARQLAAKWAWLEGMAPAERPWRTLSALLRAWRAVKPRSDEYVTEDDVIRFLGGRAVA